MSSYKYVGVAPDWAKQEYIPRSYGKPEGWIGTADMVKNPNYGTPASQWENGGSMSEGSKYPISRPMDHGPGSANERSYQEYPAPTDIVIGPNYGIGKGWGTPVQTGGPMSEPYQVPPTQPAWATTQPMQRSAVATDGGAGQPPAGPSMANNWGGLRGREVAAQPFSGDNNYGAGSGAPTWEADPNANYGTPPQPGAKPVFESDGSFKGIWENNGQLIYPSSYANQLATSEAAQHGVDMGTQQGDWIYGNGPQVAPSGMQHDNAKVMRPLTFAGLAAIGGGAALYGAGAMGAAGAGTGAASGGGGAAGALGAGGSSAWGVVPSFAPGTFGAGTAGFGGAGLGAAAGGSSTLAGLLEGGLAGSSGAGVVPGAGITGSLGGTAAGAGGGLLPTGAAGTLGGTFGGLTQVGTATGALGGSLGGLSGSGGAGMSGNWWDTAKSVYDKVSDAKSIYDKIMGMTGEPQGQGKDSNGSLLAIPGGIYNAQQNKDYSNNMKKFFADADAKQAPFRDKLRASYEDPNSFYGSNEYKGLASVYQNSIDRKAAQSGRLANPTDREVLLQQHALKEMDNYRKTLTGNISALDPSRYADAWTKGSVAERDANAPVWAGAGGFRNAGEIVTGISNTIKSGKSIWDTISGWFD